jgi:RNA-directed DNA polymerase
VVDIDIEKFFDRVNHDILMSRLARKIDDKRLLRIIRRFLEAGIMSEGLVTSRHEGTPQGGPLSPLLSNVLLDDLDKELERRGHRFCRYADDCNVYVQSQAAAERVLASLSSWLERKLKLKVNRQKSAAAATSRRSFLGYTVLSNMLLVAAESWQRLKSKLRRLTRRRSAIRLEDRLRAINDLTRGWVNYFGLASCKNRLLPLDEWLRHRLRCIKLQELKRVYPRVRLLVSLGVAEPLAWDSCRPGKGLWRMGRTVGANFGMSPKWFEKQGLLSFSSVYARVNR